MLQIEFELENDQLHRAYALVNRYDAEFHHKNGVILIERERAHARYMNLCTTVFNVHKLNNQQKQIWKIYEKCIYATAVKMR